MNFKSTIASVLLCAAAFSAYAADQHVGVTATPVLDSDNKFSSFTTPSDGVLSGGEDTIWFTGLAPGLYNIAVGVVGQNLSFDPLTSNLNGSTGTVIGTSQFSFFGVETTGDGTFALHLFGTAGGAALYSGNVTVTAVPEPETYIMLLTGMLLLGAVATRKKPE